MKRHISIKDLSKQLKEDVQNEAAIQLAQKMFLKEAMEAISEEGYGSDFEQRIYEPSHSSMDTHYHPNQGSTYKHVTVGDWKKVRAEVYREFFPHLDPDKGPAVPKELRDPKTSARFEAEINKRLNDIEVQRGGELTQAAQNTAADVQANLEYANKNAFERLWDGVKDSVGGTWDWIKKYAKVAGIAALILSVVFLVIYGVRQTIEMIRTIRKTKRESRDGSQVIMTIPFKNEQQMQQFFDIVKKKMSKYIEIENIDGNNVTISCDQKYMLKHVGEIKSTIAQIKGEKENQQTQEPKQIAAESYSDKIILSRLKKILSEENTNI